jgi:PAS domain S-box-containing protein
MRERPRTPGEKSVPAPSRRQSELEVQRLTDLLKESQAMAQVGGWEIDLASDRLYWTDETYRLHDTSPADFQPTLPGAIAFYAPESIPVIAAAVEQSRRDNCGFDLELQLITAKGRRIWVRANGRPVLAEGKVAKLVGAFQDITERKKAEEALRVSEAQFRSYIEDSPMAVFLSDETGRYRQVNQAAARITGYSKEDLLTMTVQDLLPPSSFAIAAAHRRRCAETGHVSAEYEFRRKDGTLGFWSVEAVMLSPTRFLGFVADISQRKAAEAMVMRMTEELEQRVLERTAQLEATNQELEAFCYSVSHDLRAPLRGIDGFSGALLADYRERLDATGQHYLSRIRQGTQRMGQLIDDLLKLSRINRSELELARVDLSGLCRKVLLDLAQANPERRVQSEVQPDMVVRADRRLLLVVLENLLGNAWKFTARSEDARIEVGEAPGTGDAPAFRIRDNGAGFEMAYAEKLFKPFQRLHASDDYEGTGIGLAIVQRIINRHGGEVWGEGTPGQGAAFFFTLPEH